ncbi:MAG: hypothetical protein UMU75_03200 [Halomonas sp.]|nr:hypothetical protein [Halomonas sp.]
MKFNNRNMQGLLAFLAGCCFSLATHANESETGETPRLDGAVASGEARNLPSEAELMRQGEDAIKLILENAQAVRFRHLYVNDFMGHPILCGEISQAGLTNPGFQRFVHDLEKGTLGLESGSEAFPLTWTVFCD